MRYIALLIVVLALLVAACAPSPAQDDSVQPQPAEEVPTEVPVEEETEVEEAPAEVPEAPEEIEVDGAMPVEEVPAEDGENPGEVIVDTMSDDTEFCTVGSEYVYEQDGSSSASIIEGLAEFKGATWCKATSVTTIEGIEVSSVYYFNEAADDIWAVVTVMGQTSETHIVDGEIVA